MSAVNPFTACFNTTGYSPKAKKRRSINQQTTTEKTRQAFQNVRPHKETPHVPNHVPNCFITMDPAAPKCPSCEYTYSRRRQSFFD